MKIHNKFISSSIDILGECSRSVNMEFITGEMSRTLVVYEEFKFRFHKILENDVQRRPCCKWLVKTSVTNEIVEKHTDHKHDRCG